MKFRHSSPSEATTFLRKRGFKPDISREGPRVWKKAENDQLVRANIELKPSGVCIITISAN